MSDKWEEYKELDDLVSVKSFSKKINVTPSFVYKLVKEKELTFCIIDGVRFVDIKKHMIFLNRKKRDAIVRKINKLLKVTK